LISCFQITFAPSEIFQKSASELKVGRRQFHVGVNGFILFVFYNITLLFDLFFIADLENDLKFANALFNQILNEYPNVASALENNYSAFESISNGLKNIVPYFQCILDISL